MAPVREVRKGSGGGVTPPRLADRVPELDGIRGIAISLVIIYHYAPGGYAPPRSWLAYLLATTQLSWSGVDLFFVLSGFLIGGILLDHRESLNYFRFFYTRRFFRIVPIYAVLLIVCFFVSTMVKHAMAGRLVWLTQGELPWLPFVLFLQNFWMAYKANMGAILLIVTWSLAVEEQFYLTLPLVVRLVSRRRLPIVLGAGVAFAPILRFVLHTLWPNDPVAWYVMMPARADALLLGVLGAMFIRDARCCEWLKRRQASLQVFFLVLVVGLGVLTKDAAGFSSPTGIAVATFGYTWLALFYLCVILYALTWPNSVLSGCLRQKWLCRLGSIAYGVYLFHFPILYGVYALLWDRRASIDTVPNFYATLFALGLTLFICSASWTFFERPLLKLGHREPYRFRVAPDPLGLSTVSATEG
jgi:peptidoglycan/LPS O-acetylase OafA/YrhL